MTCEEARELIGADPDATSSELLAHIDACPECRAYRDQMVTLNAKIRRALELELQPTRRAIGGITAGDAQPDRSKITVLPLRQEQPSPVRRRSRGLAIAASLAATVVVATVLWLSRPADSLAADVVAHVEGEPDSWSQTQAVSASKLEFVLRKSGVKLGSGMEPVVYASSCWFRGHFVPHFVVLTESGPVTVLILSNEHIAAPQPFTEAGFSGLLVPATHGSVAVLSRTPMQLEKPAEEVVHALRAAKG